MTELAIFELLGSGYEEIRIRSLMSEEQGVDLYIQINLLCLGGNRIF